MKIMHLPSKQESHPDSKAEPLLVIVDPQRACYRSLLSELPGLAGRVCFCRSGNDALQVARQSSEAVWLIAMDLPDLPGGKLVEALGRLGRPFRAALVAEQYDPQAELAAVQTGRAFFACKPLSAAWLGALVRGADLVSPAEGRRDRCEALSA